MAYILQNKFPIDLNARKAVGFSLPFGSNAQQPTSGSNVLFKPTYTTKDQIKSNLINYFLTNNGERYLNYNFGANLRDVLFEGIRNENLLALKKRLQENIKLYFPSVLIQNLKILSTPDQNLVKVELTYNVVNFGIEDTIDLIVQ